MTVDSLCWPPSRLAEGIEELARRARLHPAPGEAIAMPEGLESGGRDDLEHWIDWVGRRLAIDIEPTEAMVPDVDRLLLGGGPAILTIATPRGPLFLLLLSVRFGTPRLLAPDLRVRSCPVEMLRAGVCAEYEDALRPAVDRLLDAAGIGTRRRERVRAALLRERLASQRIAGCWMLRPAAGSRFARQLVRENVPWRLAAMLALFAAVYGCELLGWAVLGDAALNGRVDFGWLDAWILLVLSMIPLRLGGGWVMSNLALDLSGLLKTRLLAGALRLDIDAVRHQGVGQLLGRVMECQALEALTVNGGLAAVVALIEFGFAAWVLGVGAGGRLHVVLLAAWLAVTVALGWRYYRRLSEWTAARLEMTHDLIEQMVGHRTRLVQESRDRRERDEDHGVKDYLAASARMDAAIMPVLTGIPAGWMLIGLVGLAPAFVAGTGTPVGFAIALGGVLLANRAFSGITEGLAAAARAAIAWKQAGPLFRAAATAASTTPFVPRRRAPGGRAPRLIEADGLTFRFQPQGGPVVDDVRLSLEHGERVLLEGASGGGKSSLASLLSGLRRPDSGLLLLNGLDRHTLGDAWHRVATEAPQFHENHVFTATLGFNLLMGRNWPAGDAELAEARQLCVELGLDDLLQRMPSGMMQTVGETGWQLSHGERSRIFLARALLQGAQLTILDESFAALDPETLKLCLDCALRRAETLVVIAHP